MQIRSKPMSHLVNLVVSFIKDATPVNISVEMDYDYEGNDLTLQWGTWDVFDDDDGYEEEETQGKIEREELYNLLSNVFEIVVKEWKGFVEEGTSDLSEGIYRIRLH